MKSVWVLAKNTFLELIRDRILYGLLVFAVLLIGLSLALGQLSFAEQSRISANFGFTAIHLSMVVLSIFVGSTLVAKELDKKTIFTLLARPLSRPQFLLGKCLGLTMVTLTVVMGLAVMLCFVFLGLSVPIDIQYLTALFGIILESFVLLGLTTHQPCCALGRYDCHIRPFPGDRGLHPAIAGPLITPPPAG